MNCHHLFQQTGKFNPNHLLLFVNVISLTVVHTDIDRAECGLGCSEDELRLLALDNFQLLRICNGNGGDGVVVLHLNHRNGVVLAHRVAFARHDGYNHRTIDFIHIVVNRFQFQIHGLAALKHHGGGEFLLIEEITDNGLHLDCNFAGCAAIGLNAELGRFTLRQRFIRCGD